LLFEPSLWGGMKTFYVRTIKSQVDRESPFSLWDWRQYHAKGIPDLHRLQQALEVLLVIGAVAAAFFPRRKSPLQLAALTAPLPGPWWGVHTAFFVHDATSDLPVYRDYGNAIEHGLVPYRDFDVEYPPAALPIFALPSVAPGSYSAAFDRLIWLCGVAVLTCMAFALRALRAPPERLWAALGFAALAPLALGSV